MLLYVVHLQEGKFVIRKDISLLKMIAIIAGTVLASMVLYLVFVMITGIKNALFMPIISAAVFFFVWRKFLSS